MDNFITFDYNSVIPSDLSSKKILMLGRANDEKKRFKIGILSMEYVIPEIPQCQLIIISNLTGVYNQKNLIYNLNLENNINSKDITIHIYSLFSLKINSGNLMQV